jgi:hypothetical protein
LVLPERWYRAIGVADPRPIGRRGSDTDNLEDGIGKEVRIGMSFKPKKFAWKSALFSLASLATLVLAAGARYKPN